MFGAPGMTFYTYQKELSNYKFILIIQELSQFLKVYVDSKYEKLNFVLWRELYYALISQQLIGTLRISLCSYF